MASTQGVRSIRVGAARTRAAHAAEREEHAGGVHVVHPGHDRRDGRHRVRVVLEKRERQSTGCHGGLGDKHCAPAPLMPPSERSTQGASTWSTPGMTARMGGIASASCRGAKRQREA